jgi:hypothetical protein
VSGIDTLEPPFSFSLTLFPSLPLARAYSSWG